MTQTPCGLPIISRRARLQHVLTCPDPRCCEAGALDLEGAAVFRRGGAMVDAATLIALRILEDEQPTKGAS